MTQNAVTTTETKDLAVQPDQNTNAILAVIVKAASDPNVDVNKMMALLDMQERIMAKQAEIDFNQALARISEKMPRIKRNGSVAYEDKQGNKKEAFKFARYEDIDEIIRPYLREEGFSLSFTTEERAAQGGGCCVIGTLSHKSGHSRSSSISLALDSSGGKNNIQAMGSTFSYGKRYTACALLNIVTEGEDDDGNKTVSENALIDEDQMTQLDNLLTKSGLDKLKFWSWLGVAGLEDVRVKDFERAKVQINLRIQKNMKAGQ